MSFERGAELNSLVSVHEDSFTGEQFCEWLLNTFTDVRNPEEAADWGRSLFVKGLIGKLICGVQI